LSWDERDPIVQDARIALLEHNTSQMQQCKIAMLTIVIALVPLAELWCRLIPLARVTGAGILGFAFTWSFFRALWYGQLCGVVLSSRPAPSCEGTEYNDLNTPLYRLSQGQVEPVRRSKRIEEKREEKKETRREWIYRNLCLVGDHANWPRLIACSLLFGAVAMWAANVLPRIVLTCP